MHCGTFSQRIGRPKASQGNPFRRPSFIQRFIHSIPKMPSQIQLLETTHSLSFASLRRRFQNVGAAVALHFLEENQRRFFRKPVLAHLNASCPTFIC